MGRLKIERGPELKGGNSDPSSYHVERFFNASIEYYVAIYVNVWLVDIIVR